ncbi:MAG TPA: CpsD/CapB family tyrosine-protein kinase [Steroidobacteraceae bacterium]|nr:CpsD/CapB family tyrosine-protein kinase [Steroidobacteraceae bacterium]
MERTNTIASNDRTVEFPRAQRDARVAAFSQHDAMVPQENEYTDTITFRSPVVDVDTQWLQDHRVLLPGAGGAAGGAYKMLRAQVLRRLDQMNTNALAVISPGSGDGKTLTAINLAVAIASESARTVLLVDFDLRNPGVAKRLNVTSGLGVEQTLQENRAVQEAMIKLKGYDRLTILPALSRVENSSELLSTQTIAGLTTELRSRYTNRVLIFDLPPVLLADDALVFSKHVPAALMVINEGLTRREDVLRAMQLMQDTKIIGTVLTASREQQHQYY